MADDVATLRAKYLQANRYKNFGAVLRSLQVCGFRGISDLTIRFDFPITAISGLNGAGKSTIGQLAMCGYKKPSTAVDYKRFNVVQFFPVSVADPDPFSAQARAVYTLETNVASAPQEVTVSRAAAASKWSGYKRQPERYCFYIGFTLYIPKVERRDMSIYGGKTLELKDKRFFSGEAKQKVAHILNQVYEDVHFQGVGHGDRVSELGIMRRYGKQYSENNMGFGEGRVLHLVSLMEDAPQQSLFILEEPETSLHEEAQYRLIQYLLDVCNRRNHQIIFSTHSSVMLEALPQEARLLLYRDSDGVTSYKGISSTRARAILSGGEQRALTICVEDTFARSVLRELIRIEDSHLIKAVAIEAIGSNDAVREAVKLLQKLNRKALGVRDGDTGAAPSEKLYSLPGTKPPENEVFENPAVLSRLVGEFSLTVEAMQAAANGADHHAIGKRIADLAEVERAHLEGVAISEYVKHVDPVLRQKLVADIAKEA